MERNTFNGYGLLNLIYRLIFLIIGFSAVRAQYVPVGYQFTDVPATWLIDGSTFGQIPVGTILAGSSNDLTEDECQELRDRVGVYTHTFKNRQAYDSSRYFLEHCFRLDDAWRDFQKATYSCNAFSQEFKVHEWPNYVDWLQSVLYLREDSIWYCSDVTAIATAMVNLDSTKYFDYRTGISVLKYLVDSVDCGILNTHLKRFYDDMIESQLYVWRDSVQDSILTPPDTTTLYTLDELGLSSLRQPHSSVSGSGLVGSGVIADLIVAPNPTLSASKLHLQLNDGAILKLEVFDALGKSMVTRALGWHGAGSYDHPIDMYVWPSGTYYVRVSVLGGEVKTAMLVKN